MLIFIAFVMMLVATVAVALSIAAVYRVTRSSPPKPTLPVRGLGVRPAVSILKPLCGADDHLEANLETFFALDYPRFELVFGVEDDTDPAVAVVRRLRARFPDVRARLLIHDGKRALNPKVSNLRAMLEQGAHDLVVISDSNVSVDANYVSTLVAEFTADPAVGVVTNIFVGVGEQTLGATLENLHLAGPVAGGVAITAVHGKSAVSVGKSMMFHRSVFARLGGFSSVASLLAEDYVMGRMFAEAGYRVRVCTTTIRNVCARTTVKTFLMRHLRWGLIRSRLAPLMYPLEPLFNPMATAIIVAVLGVPGTLALAWGVGLTLLRDGLQWTRLRGRKGLLAALPLGPAKELLTLGVWAVAPFLRHVQWRDRRYRVGIGTRLYAAQPMEAPEQLTSE